jgi:plasmid replication initiation protein
MSNQDLIVYKSNKVIEAGYKLSLNEQQLILSCIAKVSSSKPLLATQRFEVTAKEFAAKFEISEDKAYQTLKEISAQLFERYVIIDNPDPTDPLLKYTKTRWISAINYYPDAGRVSLLFAPLMLPYLSELTGNFTFYHLNNIGKMSCSYAIRLYELLMQWKTTGKREIEINWLKEQFELGENYERMYDLKKYVIEPAVSDINEFSNYQVSWTQRKTGRRVTHLTFTFAEKQPLKPKKAKTTAKVKHEPEAVKIDNVEYFAEMRKKHGDKIGDAVPQDIVEILKTQGRW